MVETNDQSRVQWERAGMHYLEVAKKIGASEEMIAAIRTVISGPTYDERQAEIHAQTFPRKRTLMQVVIDRRIKRSQQGKNQ